MKNMYRVTRPAWTNLEKAETVMIGVVGLAIGLFGSAGKALFNFLFGSRIPGPILELGWYIIELAVPVFGCLVLIRFYRKQRVGCYPSTFRYCFLLPEASNPSGKTEVVGFLHIKPDIESGEINVEGASFSWVNGQLNVDSRVGFTSIRVNATRDEKGETTCNIRFNINPEDLQKRNYYHGTLQFRLASANERTQSRRGEVYAGHLRSTRGDVQSRGYAEWYSKGIVSEDQIQESLRKDGDLLIANLTRMLKTTPLPSLWIGKEPMRPQITNKWGDTIPTPQSVVLDEGLHPYIERALTTMLTLYGLKDQSIEQFKRLAYIKAKLDEDDRLAYERDLKAGLIGLVVPWAERKALTGRAVIIRDQITPYLVGDSLLDLGCGNGLISNLVKCHFRAENIQLLDVVKYVSMGVDLPFAEYKEGEPLPIDRKYDTVLLVTVLHHATEPVELLRMAWRATNRRLIIIESVYGVHKLERGLKYELADRSDADQIGYAAFIDWFYNRVLHDDIPVPYNFTTPEKWEKIFSDCKMKVTCTTHLGQDIEIGPEYHILFVLQKD